ncbi:MAG TPA: formylmethanofuran dehydrogenase subunit C [Methanotrichaceae archaeon]|nr:formylmethanofuran dehydrogenase subunit C [Methanotrichaceae archaeon]
MGSIMLKPKGPVGIMVEAEVISPAAFAGRSREEIEQLLVWQGPVQMPISEFFEVIVEAGGNGTPEDTSIIIDGDVDRVKHIGHGMKAGRIEINGSAGMHIGSEMAGGTILVRGNAGSWAGMEMKGGLLQIQGDAGDHVGCVYRGSWRGMSGGKILIEGDARSQLGGGMTGGEIQVGKDVENFCGIRQSGGLIIVKGNAVRGVGAEMTGGTIAVCGRIKQLSPGFVEAGSEDNPKLGENPLAGKFTRLSGDYAISKNPKGVLYAGQGW